MRQSRRAAQQPQRSHNRYRVHLCSPPPLPRTDFIIYDKASQYMKIRPLQIARGSHMDDTHTAAGGLDRRDFITGTVALSALGLSSLGQPGARAASRPTTTFPSSIPTFICSTPAGRRARHIRDRRNSPPTSPCPEPTANSPPPGHRRRHRGRGQRLGRGQSVGARSRAGQRHHGRHGGQITDRQARISRIPRALSSQSVVFAASA